MGAPALAGGFWAGGQAGRQAEVSFDQGGGLALTLPGPQSADSCSGNARNMPGRANQVDLLHSCPVLFGESDPSPVRKLLVFSFLSFPLVFHFQLLPLVLSEEDTCFFGGESSPGLGHSTRRIITAPDSSPQWLHAGEFHVALFLSLLAQSRQLSSHQMLERRQRSVRTFTLLGLITLELWGWGVPFRDCGLSLVSIQFHEK